MNTIMTTKGDSIMKKAKLIACFLFVACFCILSITGCSYNYNSKTTSYKSSSSSSNRNSNFTNAYGTPTTKCAHRGCTNYIASSGNTNCCTVHSNKCLECHKYIDEDALYCMSCIEKISIKLKRISMDINNLINITM